MNGYRLTPLARALVLVGAVLGWVPQPASSQPFHWVAQPGMYSELRHGERPVVRYMHERYDNSSRNNRQRTNKVFHHVFSPGGSQLLTNGAGGLYPHHRGLFYGFRITRYGDDQVCDTWHCTAGTHQSHVETLRQWSHEFGGGHRLRIDWYADDDTVILHEQRQIDVAVRDGGLQIDFGSILSEAGQGPVVLDGDPQHAGFHFRAANDVAATTSGQTYYLRTDGRGKPGETRNWTRDDDRPMNRECTNRPWNAMSFVLGDQRYTVLYLDHPQNPKPARYSEREYGRFGSYFVATVKPSEPVEMRYRLWIQEGEMTVEQCAAMSDEFSQNAPTDVSDGL